MTQYRDVGTSEWPAGYIGGCLELTDDTRQLMPPRSRTPLTERFPREKWPDLAAKNRSLGTVVRRVYDQGRTGSCAVASTVGAWFVKAIIQFGIEVLPPDGLSCIPVYKELVRSPNQGVAIPVAVRHMQQHGTLPLDTPGNRQWLKARRIDENHVAPENDWNFQLPSGAEETRKHFRIDQTEGAETYDELVGATFTDDPAVYGRDVHAVVSIWSEILREAGRITAVISMLNSWGNWGAPLGTKQGHIQYGRGEDSERKLRDQVGRYGIVVVKSVYPSKLFD